MAAREMGDLSLPDALSFRLLLADLDPGRFARAAPRWHGRFVLEPTGITLDKAALGLSALAALGGSSPQIGLTTLGQLATTYSLSRSRQCSGVNSARQAASAG
jgi:hypothetical protein